MGGRKNRNAGSDVLVAFGSQNGQAEEIAILTYKNLLAAGKKASLLPLNEVKAQNLLDASKIFVVASTTGVGDAPTNATKFEQEIMQANIDLSGREFAILALGDKNYPNFCAFGKRINEWFTKTNIKVSHEIIEVDDLSETALNEWDNVIKSHGGSALNRDDIYEDFVLENRKCLNPTSDAPKIFELWFKTPVGQKWEAGDIFEIITSDGHRRDYSIASIQEENIIKLFVRQVIKKDGSIGSGSSFITQSIHDGATIKARVKKHVIFHTPKPLGSCLMIGAGSGFAGLRPHILKLSEQGDEIFMVYGERSLDKDNYMLEQVQDLLDSNRINRLYLAMSREQDMPRYVQDAILKAVDEIKPFLEKGGNIMICGGLDMGIGVRDAIVKIMGQAWLEKAAYDGRILKDLY